MKWNFLFICFCLYNFCNAQGTITISGNTSVEVGVPSSYSFKFTPIFPQNANAFQIKKWTIRTQDNHLSQAVEGSINGVASSNLLELNGTNLNSTISNIPIKWGDGTDFIFDIITASVNVRYFNSSTGQDIQNTNQSPMATLQVNVQRINTPTISGPSSIANCMTTLQTHSANNSNGDVFSWSVTGATIAAGTSSTNQSVVVLPTLTGNYTLSCEVRRSAAVTAYVRTGTKTVTRLAPTTTATINGNAKLCSGSNTYTVTSLPAGQSISSWSISNPAIASLTTSGSTATLTKISKGTVTLTVTILNSCGQPIPKTKTINVGSPTIPSTATVNGPTNVGTNQTYTYSLSQAATNGATSYTWSIDAPPADDSGLPLCSWQILSGQGTQSALIRSGCTPGLAVVRVVATSSCGSSNMKYTYVTIDDPCPTIMRLSQNPIHGGGFTAQITEEYPCPTGSGKLEQLSYAENEIRIFDISGTQVYNDHQYSNELTIDGLTLKNGIYFLQVITNTGKVITEKLIFE